MNNLQFLLVVSKDLQNNQTKRMIFILLSLHVHLTSLLVCLTSRRTVLYKFSFLEAATGTNPNAQAGDEKNEFVEATIR